MKEYRDTAGERKKEGTNTKNVFKLEGLEEYRAGLE